MTAAAVAALRRLRAAGHPAKDVKVAGRSIIVTCASRSAADRWWVALRRFCATVHGPVEAKRHAAVNRNTVLSPSLVRVWVVGGRV